MEKPVGEAFIKRCREQLATIGLTLEDINSWIYYGGDSGSHLKYLKLKDAALIHDDKCIFQKEHKCMVCNANIGENCYISNPQNDDLLVIGNCCIKRFIDKDNQGRTCRHCGDPHRNRTDDLCTPCRTEKRKKDKLKQKLLAKLSMYELMMFKNGRTFVDAGNSDKFVKWFWENQNKSKTHHDFKEYLYLIGKGLYKLQCCNIDCKFWDNSQQLCVRCVLAPSDLR